MEKDYCVMLDAAYFYVVSVLMNNLCARNNSICYKVHKWYFIRQFGKSGKLFEMWRCGEYDKYNIHT